MRVILDERERDLYSICENIVGSNMTYVKLSKEVLPLGDIYVKTDEDKDVLIIERKTINDLLSSIKDGRYEEQSYRLNGLPIHNHNIVYLVEGDVNKFNVFKDRMEKLTLYSAMVSLNFYKGFSVMRSFNIEESALILCNMAHKIGKCESDGKQMFYRQLLENVQANQESKGDDSESTLDSTLDSILDPPFSKVEKADNYCTVAKKVKKDNVTPQNIGEIMLSQIPGVSSTIAIALMKKFDTLQNLVMKINENNQCLKDLSYTSEKGQTRKINKTALNNIITYLKPNINEKECTTTI
jgi:crossover junction endonuclease MUS81